MPYRVIPAVLLLAATLLLAGCDSAEERAEAHFQTGMEHLEAGDSKLAILEMRNALQLVPDHQQARLTLARVLHERGNLPRAVGHYRELVEFYPQNGEGHLALAEIGLELGEWEIVERHGVEAEALLGDGPRIAAVSANLAYRDGLFNGDREARAAAIDNARALIEAHPELLNARRLVIDAHLRDEDWLQALPLIEAGLEIEPDRYELYQMRIGVLEELGREDEITAQLIDMVTRFPDEGAIPRTLVRWYIEQEDLDAAEDFLRHRAEETPDDLDRQIELARFLNDHRGYEAVTAELSRLTEAGGANAMTFRAMRANLVFDNGDQAEAIADLQDLLAGLPEDEKSGTVADEIRVDLARMLALTDDKAGAKTLVGQVLDNDTTQTSALKLRAAWQIDEDNVEDAIINLRIALRESPRDPDIMTLMAVAHERAGEHDLQGEMLALAVEASRGAPEESLRYARLLIEDERYLPAEDVLLNALRLRHDNAELYFELGRVYVALADWSRAAQVIRALNELSQQIDDPDIVGVYNSLQTQVLAGQQRDDELFAFLEDLADTDTGLAADVAIIRAHTVRGETGKARERLQLALAKEPDSVLLKFLDASVKAVDGQYDAAEAELEALVATNPDAEQIWMALYRLHLVQGDRAAAVAVLDRALAQMPEAPALLFAQAGELEAAGDIDGAIAIYEALYARNSGVEVVANNLASLLSMHREGEESLRHAYRIGRRLRNSNVPAFRDTYGWIAARLGRFEEAAGHLAMASDAYPNHPVVQFHYAVALAGMGEGDQALEIFRRVQGELGTDLLPDTDRAVLSSEIDRLSAVPAEPANQ